MWVSLTDFGEPCRSVSMLNAFATDVVVILVSDRWQVVIVTVAPLPSSMAFFGY